MKNIAIVVVLLVLYGCSSKEFIHNDEISYIEWDSLIETDILNDAKTSIEYVKLETTQDCIINYIKRIEEDDNLLFIEDGMQKIHVFDKHGKFLYNIGRKGGASNEYITLYDFALDREKKNILLFDFGKQAALFFDYQGKYLKRELLGADFPFDGRKVAFVNSSYMLSVNTNEPESVFNFSVLDLNKGTRKDYIPYISRGEKCSMDYQGRFCQLNEDILLRAELSDTIYMYSNGKVAPKYVFNGSYKHATSDDVKGRQYEVGQEAASDLLEKQISIGMNQLFCTNKIIYFSIFDRTGRYRIFYNTTDNIGYKFDSSEQSDVYSDIWGHLIASTSDAFICEIPIVEYQSEPEINKSLPELRNLLNNSKDEDNPILAFFHLEF